MKISRATLFGFLILSLSPSMMAASRVFVSGSGMDTGACPITAPCRSFSYAMTQISPSGEVIALDTAGYGVVTISQAVTIVAAPGATAFIAAPSVDAIDITAGASDIVTLRGLALTATGTPANGISFQSGLTLNVENCVINGFVYGVYFARNGDASGPQVHVLNSTVRNNMIGLFASNLGAGSPAGGPPANLSYVVVAGSSFTGNGDFGIQAADNSRVQVSGSVFAASANGVFAEASADFSFSEINLESCNISGNFTGVFAGDAASASPHGVVRLANCMITGNQFGINTTPDGSTMSRMSSSLLTNTIEGNDVDGAPSTTYSAK